MSYSRFAQPPAAESTTYTFELHLEVVAADLTEACAARSALADRIFQQDDVLSIRATVPTWRPVKGKSAAADSTEAA